MKFSLICASPLLIGALEIGSVKISDRILQVADVDNQNAEKSPDDSDELTSEEQRQLEEIDVSLEKLTSDTSAQNADGGNGGRVRYASAEEHERGAQADEQVQRHLADREISPTQGAQLWRELWWNTRELCRELLRNMCFLKCSRRRARNWDEAIVEEHKQSARIGADCAEASTSNVSAPADQDEPVKVSYDVVFQSPINVLKSQQSGDTCYVHAALNMLLPIVFGGAKLFTPTLDNSGHHKMLQIYTNCFSFLARKLCAQFGYSDGGTQEAVLSFLLNELGLAGDMEVYRFERTWSFGNGKTSQPLQIDVNAHLVAIQSSSAQVDAQPHPRAFKVVLTKSGAQHLNSVFALIGKEMQLGTEKGDEVIITKPEDFYSRPFSSAMEFLRSHQENMSLKFGTAANFQSKLDDLVSSDNAVSMSAGIQEPGDKFGHAMAVNQILRPTGNSLPAGDVFIFDDSNIFKRANTGGIDVAADPVAYFRSELLSGEPTAEEVPDIVFTGFEPDQTVRKYRRHGKQDFASIPKIMSVTALRFRSGQSQSHQWQTKAFESLINYSLQLASQTFSSFQQGDVVRFAKEQYKTLAPGVLGQVVPFADLPELQDSVRTVGQLKKLPRFVKQSILAIVDVTRDPNPTDPKWVIMRIKEGTDPDTLLPSTPTKLGVLLSGLVKHVGIVKSVDVPDGIIADARIPFQDLFQGRLESDRFLVGAVDLRPSSDSKLFAEIKKSVERVLRVLQAAVLPTCSVHVGSEIGPFVEDVARRSQMNLSRMRSEAYQMSQIELEGFMPKSQPMYDSRTSLLTGVPLLSKKLS